VRPEYAIAAKKPFHLASFSLPFSSIFFREPGLIKGLRHGEGENLRSHFRLISLGALGIGGGRTARRARRTVYKPSTSCRLESFGATEFPGADSMIPTHYGAVSGRCADHRLSMRRLRSQDLNPVKLPFAHPQNRLERPRRSVPAGVRGKTCSPDTSDSFTHRGSLIDTQKLH
jgi:hypothetical protein